MARSGTSTYLGFGALVMVMLYILFLYNNVKQSFENSEQNLASATTKISNLKDELSLAQDHISRVTALHTEAKSSLDSCKNEKGALEGSKTLLDECNREKTQLQVEINHKDSDCTSRIESHVLEFQNLQKDKEKLDAEIREQKQLSTSEVEQLKLANKDLTEKVVELERNIAGAQSDLQQNEKLKLTNEDLSGKLANAQKELNAAGKNPDGLQPSQVQMGQQQPVQQQQVVQQQAVVQQQRQQQVVQQQQPFQQQAGQQQQVVQQQQPVQQQQVVQQQQNQTKQSGQPVGAAQPAGQSQVVQNVVGQQVGVQLLGQAGQVIGGQFAQNFDQKSQQGILIEPQGQQVRQQPGQVMGLPGQQQNPQNMEPQFDQGPLVNMIQKIADKTNTPVVGGDRQGEIIGLQNPPPGGDNNQKNVNENIDNPIDVPHRSPNDENNNFKAVPLGKPHEMKNGDNLNAAEIDDTADHDGGEDDEHHDNAGEQFEH